MLWTDLEIFRSNSNLPPDLLRKRGEKAQNTGSVTHRPTILVVDDQRLIADTVAEILNNAGFDATPVYDGKTALELAEKSQPDYVLADVLMPILNGVELAIAVRNRWPDTKILLFSGQAGTGDVLQYARKRGFEFELVPKPIHPEKLIQRLKQS